MVFEEIYVSGEYLKKHPTWHVESAPWKVREIQKMIARTGIQPQTICEVGCGVGGILELLQKGMDSTSSFWGYDISPQAIELARTRENKQLQFKQADMTQENAFFDLMLMIDMLEHVENCFSFLRNLKPKSTYKMLQIALELNVITLLLHPNDLLGFRGTQGHVGHVHYFTKNIALALLEDLGYEVVDYFYTFIPPRSSDPMAWKLIRPLQKLLFALHQDFTVRLFGGCKLMVLVK